MDATLAVHLVHLHEITRTSLGFLEGYYLQAA